MQRSKSLALVAEIFNKLSSRTFISKTCSTHKACLPLYICTHCFPTNKSTLCEQCFKEHNCEKKSKGQLSRWVSEQQEKIGKNISSVFKDFDNSRQTLLSGKIRINEKGQQRHISQINNEIITGVTRRLQKAQKSIEENCTMPALQGPLKASLQAYASAIKIKLNGLSGNLSEIFTFLQFCEVSSNQVQLQIQNQSNQAFAKSSIFYKQSLKQLLSETFAQVFGEQKTNESSPKCEDVNERLKNARVQNLLKEIDSQKQLIAELQDKICKTQQEYKNQLSKRTELVQINKQIISQNQQQQRAHRKKQSELEEKLKEQSKIIGQSSEKASYIKKLESKIKVYQNQLAQFARDNVSQQQKPQSRFNMEEMANKMNQLGQQNELLIVECNGKDKKIAELVVEINKMKIRKNEERLQHSSGKKIPFQ